MNDVTKLRKLLVRVESATGPDRRVDFDLARTFFDRWKDYDEDEFYDNAHFCPRLTSSADDALQLCDEIVPGCSVLMAKNPNRAVANVHTDPLGVSGKWYACGSQATLSLAICAAALRAKIAMLEEGQTAL